MSRQIHWLALIMGYVYLVAVVLVGGAIIVGMVVRGVLRTFPVVAAFLRLVIGRQHGR